MRRGFELAAIAVLRACGIALLPLRFVTDGNYNALSIAKQLPSLLFSALLLATPNTCISNSIIRCSRIFARCQPPRQPLSNTLATFCTRRPLLYLNNPKEPAPLPSTTL